MPCSLGFSSLLPPSLIFSKISTKNQYYINGFHHHHQPKNFASKTLHLSHITTESPFNFIVMKFNNTFRIKSCCFASNSSALCLSEMKAEYQESNSKSKVKQLIDKIRATPLEERSKFLENMIEEHGESKKIGYFNDIIMALMMAEELDLALKLFDEMPLLGLTPDCWTYSILVRCYCKKNLPDEGKRVLDIMTEYGFRPNVITLTILVNSLCSRGRLQIAFEVMEMMGRYGCKPNVQTYNCVLKGLCFVGKVEEAYEMLMSLKRKGSDEESSTTYPDIYSYTAVMDGLCKVGRSDEAMELLQEAIGMGLTPNVITYNALFNGYCKEGQPRKGIRLLKLMKDRGCVPDYISYSTLLHGLLKWGKFVAAYRIYREMVEAGFKVDERMMNTLVKHLCRNSWEEDELLKYVNEVFVKMKSWDHSIFPDTYYLVIQSFCIGGELDMALITLNEMVEAGHFPRMVTINRIIRGLCGERRISQAVSVLVLVCEAGKFPSKISFNILIDEFNSQGFVLGACSVYAVALKLGVIPHRSPLNAQQSRSP